MAGRAHVRVNVAAIERNVRTLSAVAAPARLCAVVKADGYGHGLLATARAARRGGASLLAVAGAAEAVALRSGLSGSDADARILVLGALTAADLDLAISAGAEVAAWSPAFADAVAAAATRRRTAVTVHVKLDSGLGRLGTRDAREATATAERVAAHPTLLLGGLWTHLATADEPSSDFAAEQLGIFRAWAEPVAARHPGALMHAANSAATLAIPESRLDLVRCGVGIYGLDPFGVDPAAHGLEPALSLRARVGAVKPCLAGQSAGYGRAFLARATTRLATITIGYGDGYRRAFSGRAPVLLGNTRFPLVGRVSMDNITVDVGTAGAIEPGAEAVLLGSQGDESISAEELADLIGTINYEITCALGPRLPRVHHRDGTEI